MSDWMAGANRDPRAWRSGTMSRNTAAVRAVLHTTENTLATDPKAVANYLWGRGPSMGYHLMVPLTDRYQPLQMRPARVSAGGLLNNGSLRVSPNKEGTLLVQVALVAYATDGPASKNLGPWWPHVLTWLRELGVPDRIIGPMPPGGGKINKMPLDTWYSAESGWCFHATAPNPNSQHWDPGVVKPEVLFAGAVEPPKPEPPKPQPQPPATFTLTFDGGGAMSLRFLKKQSPLMRGGDVKSVQGILNQKGFNAGSEDGIFGNGTEAAVTRAQRAMGLNADGVVGPITFERLYER